MPEAPTLTPAQPPTIVLDRSATDATKEFNLSLEKSLGEAIEKDRGRTASPAKDIAPAPTTPPTKPAAPAPTPTPAPKPPEDITAQPDWRPKTAKDWDTVKQKHTETLRDYEARLTAEQTARQALEKRLAEIPDPTLFEKTKAERDEFSKQLKAVAYAKHPEVQAAFKKRESDALSLARMAVNPDMAAKVENLIRSPNPVDNPELGEIMQNLTPLRAGRLQRAIEEMDLLALDRQRVEAEGAQHFDSWQQQQAETARKQLAERKGKMSQSFDNVLKEWSDPENGMPIYQTREGDAAWNAQVDARKQEAQKYLTDGLPDSEVIKAALFYSGRGAIVEQLQSQATVIDQLREELKSYKAAQPGVHSPGSAADNGPRNEPPEKALERLLNQPGVFSMRA